MRIKSFKLFGIVILMTLTGLIVFGCGKQGNRFANIAPTIQITSYEGYDPADTTGVFNDSTQVTLFQQKIFWHAIDTDGVIAGFAYRVVDINGNYISTPGNEYVDVTGEVTPDNVLAKYGRGWVLHYKPGAIQDIPLNDPAAKRTIWTDKKYALVNFKASTTSGLADTTISRFEVICVDNRGEVCKEIALRKFTSWSAKPTCYISTTKGDPAGAQVGTGIRLSFSLNDDDPFIQPTPWYYEFKLQKCSVADSSVISELPVEGWYSTINQPKLNQFLLTKYTNPGLSNDYDAAGSQVSFTRAIGRVVDLAGIISDPDTIFFAVKEGFHPQTLIYQQRVYALGNNHYIGYPDESTPEILPYTVIENELRYATPFFKDRVGDYTAVNSSNLKSWIRWGWHGEYGLPQPSGNIIITDNPFDKKVDVLLDETTNTNYFSEITYFDLRLDGAPYNYPPLAHSIHTDNDGITRWLRVPVNSPLGQTIVLTNLPAGLHTFEVRAVDLQGEADPTPATFSYKIVNPVPKAQKSGILVIDDDVNNNSFAPEDSIDARYANMISGYSGTKDYIKRHTQLFQDNKNRKIALSDIQDYKLIIYHNDFITVTSNLPLEHDAFALYLKQGGNMVVSGGANIHGMVQAFTIARQRLLETYFGVDYSTSATGFITNNMLSNTYMVKAVSQSSSYNTQSLAFDLAPNNPEPQNMIVDGEVAIVDPNEKSFVGLLQTRVGLGPLAYFLSYPTGTAIYEYGSKPVILPPDTAPGYFPSQAAFDNVNGRTLGLKKVTANNSCYILSFPLSYMKKADSKAFMSTVISEVMGTK